jgi:hypothetical protein
MVTYNSDLIVSQFQHQQKLNTNTISKFTPKQFSEDEI